MNSQPILLILSFASNSLTGPQHWIDACLVLGYPNLSTAGANLVHDLFLFLLKGLHLLNNVVELRDEGIHA